MHPIRTTIQVCPRASASRKDIVYQIILGSISMLCYKSEYISMLSDFETHMVRSDTHQWAPQKVYGERIGNYNSRKVSEKYLSHTSSVLIFCLFTRLLPLHHTHKVYTVSLMEHFKYSFVQADIRLHNTSCHIGFKLGPLKVVLN